MKIYIKSLLKNLTRIFIFFLIISANIEPTNAIQYGQVSPMTPLVLPINTVSRPGFYFTCSGTLITPVKVLTAAHCVFNKEGQISDSIQVGSPGSSNAISPENISRWKKVTQVQIARGFNINNNQGREQNDIAILTLALPIEKSPLIKFPTSSEIDGLFNSQKDGVIFGYGQTEPGVWPEFPSKILGKINANYGQKEFEVIIQSGRICGGDSGGPIYLSKDNFYLLVGVISRSGGGDACGTSGFAATYLHPYMLEFNLSLAELNTTAGEPTPTNSKPPEKASEISIKCQKNGAIKTIKGINPKCPKGYKQKIYIP